MTPAPAGESGARLSPAAGDANGGTPESGLAGAAAGAAGAAGGDATVGGTGNCELALLAEADSYILANAPAGNTGQAALLAVTRLGASSSTRSLVQFNLGAAPQGVTIHAARLELVIQSNSFEDKIIAAHRLLPNRAWLELSVNWNEYAAATSWSSPGADFDSSPAESPVSSARVPGDVIGWDVTADVVYFQEHPDEYSGWLLKDLQEPAEGSGQVVRFESRETSQPPRLLLTLCD